ncbi:hypothetical protein B2G88_18650 [Natronolimnobius baerhuensis]|uniref:Uncharacterized protein n=1 Tax=Natronolimnobius baerhuensis TaxID=253108 RepID=A0A202E3M6_9EURY|nr:hypothetical protein B2G88_18650 [Natronolimnobius baerhuensis]
MVSQDNLEYIARRVDGDARQAISLLYHSVRNLQFGDRVELTEAAINDAEPDATRHIVRSRLLSLSRDQRIALECLGENGPSTSGELYVCYRDRVDDPCTKPTVRGWMPKFGGYELVVNKGPSHAPRYRVCEQVLEELDYKPI